MERNDASKVSVKGWRRRIAGPAPEGLAEQRVASKGHQGFLTKFFRSPSNTPSVRNSRSDNSDANEGGSHGGPLLVHPEHYDGDGASGKPDLTVEGSSTGEPGKITNEDVTDPAVASAPRGDPEGLRGNFSQIRLEPGFVQVSVSAVTNADATMARIDTIASYLQPLKVFDAFLSTISNVRVGSWGSIRAVQWIAGSGNLSAEMVWDR